MAQSVADAETALRAEMQRQGNGDDAQETIERVRADPNRYRSRENAAGLLARSLIANEDQQARLVVEPFVPADQPPPPGRSASQPLVLEVSSLSDHKYFRPLGQAVRPGAPTEHKFSHLQIDHHMSGFERGSAEETAIRYLYFHLMYESKPDPPCKEKPGPEPAATRGPFFTLREHDHAPPAEKTAHSETLVVGVTQLSKTPEACTTCWGAYFVDGCLPILCVRNKGGANSGSADMAKGIEGLNKRIEQLFRAEVRRGNIPLREADFSKFLLHPRRSSNGEFVEFDPNTRRLARPQAFIICMNPGQVKNLIGEAPTKHAGAGALAGLIDIMKGETLHPYPPKCHDPYKPFDDGVNRPVARMYFVLDEDDLNRSNAGSVTERLQFDMPAPLKAKLEKGLAQLTATGLAARAASSSGAAPQADADSDDELPGEQQEAPAASDYVQDGLRFKSELTGIRSAVRGVVAFTATPAACGHDVREGASRVIHQVCVMEHPANYVGYEFTAAEYAERTIRHEPVPDRKQIVAISKGIFYTAMLKRHDWWDEINDAPYLPFKRRADGAITVYKRELDDVPDGMSGKSSQEIADMVNKAHRASSQRSNKVLESDGVGIALMLESMSEKGPAEELERRALVISNYTRTLQQKQQLARHILMGDLTFEDGETRLAEHVYADLFVVVFDHKHMCIMWRGSMLPDEGTEVSVTPAHNSIDVLNAIKDASSELYNACSIADGRTGREPNFQEEGEGQIKYFDTSFCNINHVYTALLLYAHRRRFGGSAFKLKTVVLAGDLGGRGVNFKPHGKQRDAANDDWIIPKHDGYLTDMFFMFDAVKNRQITTHGEYTLQAIGRLCGLTTDECLARMAVTPPRLWTSYSCYGVIRVFALGVQQWVVAMQSKGADEPIGDAVVRCIKSDPQRFAALHMIYALPTTDARWNNKELWVRQSRLMRADKLVGEGIRSEPRMPRITGTFGIQHNPDRDKRERVERLMADAEAGEEESDDQQPPPQRPRVTRDEALGRWWRNVQSYFAQHEDDLGIHKDTAKSYLSRLQRAMGIGWIAKVSDLRTFADADEANEALRLRIEETQGPGHATVDGLVTDLKAAIRKARACVSLDPVARPLFP